MTIHIIVNASVIAVTTEKKISILLYRHFLENSLFFDKKIY